MKLKFAPYALNLILTVLLIVPLFLDAQVIDYPRASLELKVLGDGGKNGSGIAYNPESRLYYAVIAGNAQYPLEVFDQQGRNLYQTQAGTDMRGLWWNDKAGTLEGNGYDTYGIVNFGLNDQGYPSYGNSVIFEGGSYQPGMHSCGTYDAKKKAMVYYYNGSVYSYKRSNGDALPTLKLEIASSRLNDITAHALIYTGEKGMEFGVLDYVNAQVLLFDRKTGKNTKTIYLPAGVVTHEWFRFAYANEHVFIFNSDNRTWTGYKIFK